MEINEYEHPLCEVIELEATQVICGSIEAPDFGAGNGLNLDE